MPETLDNNKKQKLCIPEPDVEITKERKNNTNLDTKTQKEAEFQIINHPGKETLIPEGESQKVEHSTHEKKANNIEKCTKVNNQETNNKTEKNKKQNNTNDKQEESEEPRKLAQPNTENIIPEPIEAGWELLDLCHDFLVKNNTDWKKRQEKRIEEKERLERLEKARLLCRKAKIKHVETNIKKGLDKVPECEKKRLENEEKK